ncbi:MAG: hypothetical protein GY811_14345 [Myxococcales bacterium]|nr:hypothetical protein [Myxococcales bacterium]
MKTTRSRGKRVLAIGSALIHVALGGMLIAMGSWEISEIGRPNCGVAMATTTMPPLGGAEAKPAGKKVERAKKLVRESRQPSQASDEEVKTGGGDSATRTDGQGGDPNAPGEGPPGAGSVGGELCLDLDSCGKAMPSVPKAKDEPKTKMLPPTVLSELTRVVGDPQIQPPSSTQNELRQAQQERAVVVVKMCLDRAGAVERRYRPHRAGGDAILICTHVTFIYKQD